MVGNGCYAESLEMNDQKGHSEGMVRVAEEILTMVLCRSILSLQIFGGRNNMAEDKCTRRLCRGSLYWSTRGFDTRYRRWLAS